jgi:hypothetical protein
MNKEARTWIDVLPWMTLYAIAMALLESAVVVDLRALYYPVAENYPFPIVTIDRRIAITELLREAATMVMLLAPGAMLSRSALERLAWFAFCFGVWDIFYYVFLKAMLDWPVTLLDWDILFLVPVPWVGPVLAPCLVALGLMAFGVLVLKARRSDGTFGLFRREWAMLTGSAVIMLFAFMEGPCRHALRGRVHVLSVASSGDALDQFGDFVPSHFPWTIFLAGAVFGIITLFGILVRHRRVSVASSGPVGP